jgi:peptidoglycan/LPS O-acetylase OafA/YrhL
MRRIAELDGLRGIAAVLIIVYHLLGARPDGLWVAVDVFFVLSGYLITSIVLEHGSSWRFLMPFYLRRGLRIWPIYYLVVLLAALTWQGELSTIAQYLTYTQQTPHYWGAEMAEWPAINHTWTLAIEEQFYLIWPPLLLLAGRQWTIPLAIVVALLSIQAKMAGADWWTLLGRSDGFALGGLLAAICADADHASARKRAGILAIAFAGIAIILVTGLAMTNRLTGSVGPVAIGTRTTIASLGSFALVAAVLCNQGHPTLRILRCRPLVYLGTISYGLYLYHCPIFECSAALCERWSIVRSPAVWLLQLSLTLAIAVMSWHWIEKPILRLKDRIPYHPGEPAIETSSPTAPALGFRAGSQAVAS